MITKEKFIELINNYKSCNKRIDQLIDLLGISPTEDSLIESYWKLFEDCLSLSFTEEGCDDILWWLLEKNGQEDMKMWDKDDNEIPTETVDDLWNIVEPYRI